MPKKEFQLSDIQNVASGILKSLSGNIYCLYGEMGAGKTTLIKALVKELGGKGQGSSPTFGLVNEYRNDFGGLLAYHFDCYRIESLEEAFDIGLEDYFIYDVPIFIEWPEKIEPLLPEKYHKIKLSVIDENTRRIEY